MTIWIVTQMAVTYHSIVFLLDIYTHEYIPPKSKCIDIIKNIVQGIYVCIPSLCQNFNNFMLHF